MKENRKKEREEKFERERKKNRVEERYERKVVFESLPKVLTEGADFVTLERGERKEGERS